MTPKLFGKSAAPKKEKEPAKKSTHGSNGSKQEKKPAKGEAEVLATGDPLKPAHHGDDLEELEEQEEEAAASASEQTGHAAALAAVTNTGPELSTSFKNFRHHPDMENFYRFIFENDLRHEALAIVDRIITDKHQKKQAKLPNPK